MAHYEVLVELIHFPTRREPRTVRKRMGSTRISQCAMTALLCRGRGGQYSFLAWLESDVSRPVVAVSWKGWLIYRNEQTLRDET